MSKMGQNAKNGLDTTQKIPKWPRNHPNGPKIPLKSLKIVWKPPEIVLNGLETTQNRPKMAQECPKWPKKPPKPPKTAQNVPKYGQKMGQTCLQNGLETTQNSPKWPKKPSKPPKMAWLCAFCGRTDGRTHISPYILRLKPENKGYLLVHPAKGHWCPKRVQEWAALARLFFTLCQYIIRTDEICAYKTTFFFYIISLLWAIIKGISFYLGYQRVSASCVFGGLCKGNMWILLYFLY